MLRIEKLLRKIYEQMKDCTDYKRLVQLDRRFNVVYAVWNSEK